MTENQQNSALRFRKTLQESGLTIYDEIKYGDPTLWIPSPELQILLLKHLKGVSLKGLPLRTRSKFVKELVCKSLGYPAPLSFRKTRPRFPGQCLDTYVQKSNNLQIWNEELSPIRRYAVIRVSDDDVITAIRVVDGKLLALLDPTGTLTQKYQARVGNINKRHELVVSTDTNLLCGLLKKQVKPPKVHDSPVDYPQLDTLMPIKALFESLKHLVGNCFPDIGSDQERNRGGYLHRLVSERLGYGNYRDNGRFPDIRNQLLEVKLQTSPTIDLGLVAPDSVLPLDIPMLGGVQLRHCDVRYAIFGATLNRGKVNIENLILTTGERFFRRFKRFEGKVINRKLQIPLPSDFFGSETE
ncbi:restriction endonuclease [Deltaproteobacteria bacterium PRO3]|nr:restriction endonuclease [Deltaproteobacteria bacterium PRO3]